VSKPRGCTDGPRDKPLGGRDSTEKILALGKPGGNGGRIGAARPMGVLCPDPRGLKAVDPAILIKEIQGRSLQMTAFDKHGPRAKPGNDPRGFFHRFYVTDPETAQSFRFTKVGRNQCREREKPLNKSMHSIPRKKPRAMFADHDRIDDKRETEFPHTGRHDLNDLFIPQSTDFGCTGEDIGKDHFKLTGHLKGGHRVNRPDTLGVLRGQKSDNGHPIDLVPVKSLEIGLKAGAA